MKFITHIIFSTLLFTTLIAIGSSSQYPTDIQNHTYQQSIQYLYTQNLVEGYSDNTYRPNTTINRAEFTKIITNNTEVDTKNCKDFNDVQAEDWFYEPVCKAYSLGLIQGYPNNTFKPNNQITMAEASKIIAHFFNKDLKPGLPWYKPSVDYIREQGGQPATALDVTAPLTRGEMAYIIHKMYVPKPIVNPQPDTIPILVYHHVRAQQGWAKSTWSWKLTVSPHKFEQQLEYLSKNGYTTISLDELVAILDGATPPPKPVVITFDDNNLNQYTHAFPSLQKYGHMAVFYLITNLLQNDNYVNGSRAKEMYAAGMDIQSHTHTHSNMKTLSAQQIAFELNESKRLLEELLGNQVSHVAYPLTAHNQHVRDNVKLSGYDTGTVMDPRRATFESDRYKIPRILITDDTNMEKYLP
jgi:peptidoglycan/xylan/chitin deacetylase (PgdA/CDA1 family)